MKVIILQDKLRGGGTERQSISLTHDLQNADIDAKLIVGQSGGILDPHAQATLGSNLHFCSRSAIAAIPQTLRTLTNNHAPQKTTLLCMGRWANSLAAWIPTRRFGQRIATVRTSRPLPWLYRRAIRTADQLITNSHWALDYTIQQCGIKSNSSYNTVIHNSLSRTDLLDIDPTNRAAARDSLKIPQGAKVLLNVARFDRGKGQADLINLMALPSSHSRHLYLLGTGPEEAHLRTLTQSLGLEHCVHFPGFHENLTPYYTAADLFVSSSQLDSLPNALLEAHAAALPIVAYPTTGIPEIVQHGTTGYLTTENSIDQLNQLCTRVLHAPEHAKELGQSGRAHIQQNFDKHQQLAKYIALLRD